MVVRAGLAKVSLHEFERLPAHVEAGVEPKRVHLGAGRRPDAVEFADGQGFDEWPPHFRRDDVLAVRLAMVGGELRQKPVVGNAGRGVEAGLLFDLGSNRERDVASQRNVLQIFCNVEIGFVQRQRFDDRRMLGEDVADLLRNRLVDFKRGFTKINSGQAAWLRKPLPTRTSVATAGPSSRIMLRNFAPDQKADVGCGSSAAST
jgi:hypothetical protein